MPTAPKLSPSQQRDAAVEVVGLMLDGTHSLSLAMREVGTRYGVSRSTLYSYLRAHGFDSERLTPVFLLRRMERAAEASRLYSMAEKQGIAHQLTVLAKVEAGQLASEYERTGVMSNEMSVRLARAQAVIARAISIDEKLVRAGLPIEGWAKAESESGTAPVQGSESLLVEARRRREELRRQAEEENA